MNANADANMPMWRFLNDQMFVLMKKNYVFISISKSYPKNKIFLSRIIIFMKHSKTSENIIAETFWRLYYSFPVRVFVSIDVVLSPFL